MQEYYREVCGKHSYFVQDQMYIKKDSSSKIKILPSFHYPYFVILKLDSLSPHLRLLKRTAKIFFKYYLSMLTYGLTTRRSYVQIPVSTNINIIYSIYRMWLYQLDKNRAISEIMHLAKWLFSLANLCQGDKNQRIS